MFLLISLEAYAMEHQDSPLVGINFAIIMRQGGMITASIPTINDGLLEMKVEGFDNGGIWIQCQKLTDIVHRILGSSSLPSTPIFFVPYSAIRFAFVGVEGQSFSAEKLGL
jgi:hypothetical protein